MFARNVQQGGLLHPLRGDGPNAFVACQHMGTTGISGLQIGTPLLMRVGVGRASVTLPTVYRETVPASSRSTAFVLPVRADDVALDSSGLVLHVMLLTKGHRLVEQRGVFVCA